MHTRESRTQGRQISECRTCSLQENKQAQSKVSMVHPGTQPGSKADARGTHACHKHTHHAASRHNALTTSRTSPEARRRPVTAGRSHHFPASKTRAKHPAHSTNFAGQRNPRMDLRDAKRPKHHSQSTRTHHNTTHAASMGRAEGAPWVLSSATPFQILSKLSRGF